MDNLTKENFWNEVEKKYPIAFNLFMTWIDKYKEEVGWNNIFNSNIDYENSYGKNAPAPKFHELPFEFQNGILARFDIECCNGLFTGKGKDYYESNRPGYVQGFKSLFEDLNGKLDTQQN